MRGHTLERAAGGFGRSRSARFGWPILVVLLVLELVAVFFLSQRGQVERTVSDGDGAAPPATASRSGPSYTFEKPDGWRASREGDTTILTSEDGAVVISLGLLSGESLTAVSERVVSMLDGQYRRLAVTSGSTDGSTRVVEGTALNSAHVRLRFTAITIASDESAHADCHRQLIAFADVGESPDRVDGLIDDLVGSFELDGGCS